MKRIFAFTLLLSFAVASSGCGGGGVGYGYIPKKFGKEKVVEKSGKRPNWAFDRPMFVKNGIMYASGMFSDAPNLSKGLDIATKLAQAKLAESLQMRSRDDFTYASEGTSVDATMVERILNTTTEELMIRGFFQTQLYYEKKETLGAGGTVYKYDCYALAEISQANYAEARNAAINKNLPPSISEEFKNKVNERQRDFLRLGEKEVSPPNSNSGEGSSVATNPPEKIPSVSVSAKPLKTAAGSLPEASPQVLSESKGPVDRSSIDKNAFQDREEDLPAAKVEDIDESTLRQ